MTDKTFFGVLSDDDFDDDFSTDEEIGGLASEVAARSFCEDVSNDNDTFRKCVH